MSQLCWGMPARIEHPGLICLLVGIVFSACLALSLYLYQPERERAGLRTAMACDNVITHMAPLAGNGAAMGFR